MIMIKTVEGEKDPVSCDRLLDDLVITSPFDDRVSTVVTNEFSTMESVKDEILPFPSEVDASDVSTVAEHHRKKGNFRQRIRSLREECEDGPLLASSEDLPETDDDSGFVVASRYKRGRKSKEVTSKDGSNLQDTFSQRQSPLESDLDSIRSPVSNQSDNHRLLECLLARYPDLKKNEFDTLLETAEQQYPNFKYMSRVEMYEKLDELKIKQNCCEVDKNENIKKVPSKPVWDKVKRACQNRVLDFDECTICFDEWDSDEKIILEECGHCFHSECLQKWMKMKNTCPFCSTYSLSPNDFPKLT